MARERFHRLRLVGDGETPKKTQGMGACKYCIHSAQDHAYIKCTVFNKHVDTLRRNKTDVTGQIYLPDCREFLEKPFSRPRHGIFANIKLFLGKLLYPLILWLKK